MRRRPTRLRLALPVFAAALLAPVWGGAQTPAAEGPPGAVAQDDGTFLLTIFLRHDESKPLPEINAELKRNGYYKAFPPDGVQVVSWYVMMGIGQVVTLRVPAGRLRDVNRAIEATAWGGYRTEFYPTYDYKDLAEQARRQNAQN